MARAYWANGLASAAGIGAAALAPIADLAETGDAATAAAEPADAAAEAKRVLVRSAAIGHTAAARVAFGLGAEQFLEQGAHVALNWSRMSSSQRASAFSGLLMNTAQMMAGRVARRAVDEVYAWRTGASAGVPAPTPAQAAVRANISDEPPPPAAAGRDATRSRSSLIGRVGSRARIAIGTAAGAASVGALSTLGRVSPGPEESAGFSIARHLITLGKLEIKGRLARLINAAEDGRITAAKAEDLHKKIVSVIGKYEAPERVATVSAHLRRYFDALPRLDAADKAREFEALKNDLREDLDYKLSKIDPNDYRTRRGAALNFASASSRALNVLASTGSTALTLGWKLPTEVLFTLANVGFGVRDGSSAASFWHGDDLSGRTQVKSAMRYVQRVYAAAGVPWTLDAIARGNAGEAFAAAGFTAGASLKSVLESRLLTIKNQSDPATRASSIRTNAKRANAAYALSSFSTIAYYLASLVDSGGPDRRPLPGVPLRPPRVPLPSSPTSRRARVATHQVVVVPPAGLRLRAHPSSRSAVVETETSGAFLQATGRSAATAQGRFVQVIVRRRPGTAPRYGWVAGADVERHPRGAMGTTGRIDPALERQPQRFRAVVVRSGDSIASIAARYGANLAQVAALNASHIIDPSLIFAGDIVYLPRRIAATPGVARAW